jgi:hypothetical protein
MALNILSASRIAIAALGFATFVTAGSAQAQYGGYGSGPNYGYGSGYGYSPRPSYGYGPNQYYGHPGPATADLFHAVCEGNTVGFDDWQVDHVAGYIKLDDNQKALLATVQDAVSKAAVATHTACPSDTPLTWSGQLDTLQARLAAVLAAVQTVIPVVDAFVASLTDEQKARLNSVGFGYARYR